MISVGYIVSIINIRSLYPKDSFRWNFFIYFLNIFYDDLLMNF